MGKRFCKLKKSILVPFAIIVTACAGQQIAKITSSEPLPSDFGDRFEVKEYGGTASPSAGPSPVASGIPTTIISEVSGKKKKKSAKELAAGKGHHAGNEVPGMPGTFVVAKGSATQYPFRRPEHLPFAVGERAVYTMSYFGMVAGDFDVRVLPFKEVNQRKVFHAKGTVTTGKLAGLIYRVNDYVESFFDYDGLFSHRFHINVDESKQTRDGLELNDHEKAQTFYWNRWHHIEKSPVESKEVSPIIPFSQDSLSAGFYLRAVKYPDLGGTFSFPVISEGKTWEAVVTVVRREVLDTAIGRVDTLVLKPDTRFQGILQKRGDSFIWVTDDAKKLIVRIEAKVKIGTVLGVIDSYEPGDPSLSQVQQMSEPDLSAAQRIPAKTRPGGS